MFLLSNADIIQANNNNDTTQYNLVLKSIMENKVSISYKIPGYPKEAYSLMHMEMRINNTIMFSKGNITRRVETTCTGGWIRVNTGTSIEIKSLTPGSNGCRSIKNKIEYTDMEDFYRNTFITVYYFETLRKVVTSKFGENVTLNIKISYEGTKYYKDLPVNIFTIQGNVSGWNREYGRVSGFLKGYVYDHLGLMTPVKGELIYSISSYTLEQELNMTLKLAFDVDEENLPHSASYGYLDLGDIEVIIGGLPGSKIRVEFKKNSSKINIFNDGDNYGYVIVNLKKTMAFLNASSTRNYLVQAFLIYAIDPHSNKTVDIGVRVNKSITVTAEEYTNSPPMLEIMVFIIIAVVIIGIIWLVRK